MSSIARFTAGVVALLTLSCAAAQESPDLGTTPSPELLAAWDIDIGPDGSGLPAGSGSAAEGETLYNVNCIACHGPEGEGLLNDRLAGGHGTLGTEAPRKTVGSYWPYATTIFDYVRRAMPYLTPQTLTDDEVYALTAYLLYINDIVDRNAEMNSSTLPAVEMPNRDNFVLAYPAR
ncbi:MAG TPA: cytochrome c [Gammaproteobacteria bacterium]